MKNFKNLLIAIITGLLGISLFTFPAQGAGKSKEAKTVEYSACLNMYPISELMLEFYIKKCAPYRP
jgi:hypothetical protein